MIYITQLIYIQEGKEDVFHAFEDFAIPIIANLMEHCYYESGPAPHQLFIRQQMPHTKFILSVSKRQTILKRSKKIRAAAIPAFKRSINQIFITDSGHRHLNMLRDIENYYASKEEPAKSCLLAMRSLILKHDKDIFEAWKYKMPFFCYKGKMFCYLWVQKNTHIPYIGIVEGKKIDHPDLIIEGRSRMKIMLIDPDKDIPLKEVNKILQQAIGFYKDGTIRIKQ